MQPISVCQSCILLPFWIYQFWWFVCEVFRVFSIWYHIICIQWQFYLLSSNLDTLYFFFLFFFFFFFVWLLWLGPPVLCQIEEVRAGILDLFQSLTRRFSAFHCRVLYWLWVFHKYFLLFTDMFCLYPLW